jgi:hypothetical protein
MTTKSDDDTAARLDRIESAICDLHACTGLWHGGTKANETQAAAIQRLDEFVAELTDSQKGN